MRVSGAGDNPHGIAVGRLAQAFTTMRNKTYRRIFRPRSVEITGNFLRFKSDPASVEQKIGVLDRWMERASTKEASMAGRTEGQRQKQDEAQREAQELAEWNARWEKL